MICTRSQFIGSKECQFGAFRLRRFSWRTKTNAGERERERERERENILKRDSIPTSEFNPLPNKDVLLRPIGVPRHAKPLVAVRGPHNDLGRARRDPVQRIPRRERRGRRANEFPQRSQLREYRRLLRFRARDPHAQSVDPLRAQDRAPRGHDRRGDPAQGRDLHARYQGPGGDGVDPGGRIDVDGLRCRPDDFQRRGYRVGDTEYLVRGVGEGAAERPEEGRRACGVVGGVDELPVDTAFFRFFGKMIHNGTRQ